MERCRSTKRLLENFFHFKLDLKHPFTLVGLQLVFYQVFLMLCKIIFSNSIQTSKIVVEVDHLITSLDQLLKSDLVVCWFHGIMKTFAQEASHDAPINRIFREKIYASPEIDLVDGKASRLCILDFFKMKKLVDFSGKAIIQASVYVNTLLTRYVHYEPKDKYFESKPLFDQIMVHYYRNGLTKSQVKAINNL